jgi:hypothetical protein
VEHLGVAPAVQETLDLKVKLVNKGSRPLGWGESHSLRHYTVLLCIRLFESTRHLRHLRRSYATSTIKRFALTSPSTRTRRRRERYMPLVAFCLSHFLADFIICSACLISGRHNHSHNFHSHNFDRQQQHWLVHAWHCRLSPIKWPEKGFQFCRRFIFRWRTATLPQLRMDSGKGGAGARSRYAGTSMIAISGNVRVWLATAHVR